jgi:hypothetical protein
MGLDKGSGVFGVFGLTLRRFVLWAGPTSDSPLLGRTRVYLLLALMVAAVGCLSLFLTRHDGITFDESSYAVAGKLNTRGAS